MPTPAPSPIIISTWPFGLPANAVAWDVLGAGGAALDAVERGVTQCEFDPNVDSVGLGGLPDAAGEVTLDASIMDDRGRCGAVAGLRRGGDAAGGGREGGGQEPPRPPLGGAAPPVPPGPRLPPGA